MKARWNFRNDIGAADGGQIVVQQPKTFGSHYRDYKGTGSIILHAIVGHEYEFLFADVGMNSTNSDGGNWSQSLLKNHFETNTLNLPNPMPLPGSKNLVPIVYRRWCFSFVHVYDVALSSKEPDFRETHFQTHSSEWDAYQKMSLVSWKTAGEYLEDHSILNPKKLSPLYVPWFFFTVGLEGIPKLLKYMSLSH